MSSKRLEKKTDQIKRENLQQTKNSNIEKKSNIKTIKKVARREGYPGEANDRSKNTKPTSTTNLHRQQNKEIQQTEQLAVS